jgi:hypothetical protein
MGLRARATTRPSVRPVPDMPLTKMGRKVYSAMRKEYGSEKGKRVFYAYANKNKAKLHLKKKG